MFINSYKNINIKKYKKIILPRFIYSFKNINIKKYNFSKILSVLLNYAYDILTFYKKINFKNYKYFLIYAPLIILFITIGYLNIPLFFNYDKSNISNKICKTLNIECVIEDKIGYSFFPSPRININNFILKDPKNKNKILGKIENVIIVLPIDKLHSNKEFNFKKIKLQNPEINLNVKKIKNYLKYFNGGLNQKNIKINNGKINIFDGSKILSSIDNTDLTYKTGDKENQVNLRGNFLGDKIILKMKNVKDKPDIKKIASIKLVNSNIFSELIITNYQTEKKFGGNFLVKNERNRATAIFDYNEGILSVKKANLTNAFFEGKVDGLIKFSPFFDFDLTMDLNSFNFNKLYNLAKKAFLQESHHPAIQFAYCQIYRNLGKGNLSRRACTITAQQHPNSPETHYERAQILMALGEMKETLEELDKAIQLAPQVPQYHYEKGIIFTYFNDNIKAMGSFERALQIDQNHFDSAYQLAYILTTTGKVDKAKKYIDQIKSSGKPVVFYSGHFANFELMAMELEKLNVKVAAIYRPLNNFFLNPLMEYLRIKYICPNQIPKGRSGMREVINKVKNGFSIAVMVDQRVGEGLKVNFFNSPASTTTIPAQLALKYGCKLVPISLERKLDVTFEMTIHKPYEVETKENADENIKNITIEINQIIEKMIIKNPTQWLWSHNRWK